MRGMHKRVKELLVHRYMRLTRVYEYLYEYNNDLWPYTVLVRTTIHRRYEYYEYTTRVALALEEYEYEFMDCASKIKTTAASERSKWWGDSRPVAGWLMHYRTRTSP
eukprot:scaffold582442_cov22-Prasinocladus_malaysianus.AAC.1